MSSSLALSLRAQELSRFRTRGITIAIISGLAYGLYTAFISLALETGYWGEWQTEHSGFSQFAAVYLLGILASGLTYIISGIWALIVGGVRGKLGDTFRVLRTAPGRALMLCAVIGGPIGTVAYILALQSAGAIVIPIAALCPAFGAIISRIWFKQPLTKHMTLGIIVCLVATCLIGLSAGFYAGPDMVIGILLALLAAVAWAFEGAIGGMGTTVVDYEIAITIRQWTAGLTTLLLVLPLVGVIGREPLVAAEFFRYTLTSPSILLWVALAGFFCLFAFSLWYRGNSMCGTALGMAANGTFAFWGPFFCWLLLGVILRMPGWNIAPIAWFGALLMCFGILLIAVDPRTFFAERRNRALGVA